MLQLALDSGEGTNEQRRRARKLATEHAAAWSALEGLANRVTFRRGFVDAIEVDAQTLVEHRDEIFERAPLCEHVAITGLSLPAGERDPVDLLRAAIAALPPMRGVFLDSIATMHTTSAGHTVATRPVARMLETIVQQLRVESFGCDSHYLELAVPPRRLWINGSKSALPHGLNAVRCHQPPDNHVVPPGVAEVELVGGILFELAEARLERLTLDSMTMGYRIADIQHCPALRSLTISQSVRPHLEVQHFLEQIAALRHPALREVRAIDLSEAAVFAIAKSLGPQLRLLDVRGSAAELYLHHAELQALVAGDVVTGGHVEMRPLSWLGRRPRELMWDHPLVELRRS